MSSSCFLAIEMGPRVVMPAKRALQIVTEKCARHSNEKEAVRYRSEVFLIF